MNSTGQVPANDRVVLVFDGLNQLDDVSHARDLGWRSRSKKLSGKINRSFPSLNTCGGCSPCKAMNVPDGKPMQKPLHAVAVELDDAATDSSVGIRP
jgi:hypothetical protein